MYENNYPNNFGTSDRDSQPQYTQGMSGSTGNTYYYEEKRAAAVPEKKKGLGAGRKVILGICCGLLFGIFAGLGFMGVTRITGTLEGGQKEQSEAVLPEQQATEQDASGQIPNTSQQLLQSQTGTTVGTAATTVTDVTEVVKAAMPSIVSVNNRYVETYSFWGQQYSNEGDSAGSGIIVGQNDTELLLVTNYHVVEGTEELTVQFVDGKQAQAQMKGSDADKDLAVIAVQLSDIDNDTKSAIAIATMGDSTQLTLGEPVIAIGNALGYGQSVTNGVVSALNRPIAAEMGQQGYGQQQDEEINTFIQTNAAINPGNSGGALLNIRGEVIGITSNKIGGTAIEGMGYAIPISDAKPIIEDLMSKETKKRVSDENKGYLGITGIDVVAEYARTYGAPLGVYVSSVTEGTGAAAAGLVRGDIITALNGEEITSMEDLQNELSYYAAGETVELTIMQGSPVGYQAKNVTVTLGTASSING